VIRYEIDPPNIHVEIAAIDPKWKTKADARTKKFVNAAGYSEKSSLWSIVKPVYMRAQWYKCIFCERQFENERYGKIEFDVEHFRPKSSIEAWPSATAHPSLSYPFATGAASANGYYWLAYDVENYAASCKACNSALKANYFPIAGARGTAVESVSALAGEMPFLCYPLGTLDDNPEDLVTFVATIAKPRALEGHLRRRAQVIIDFFDLNGRDVLHRQRAQMISMFGGSLTASHAGTDSETDRKVIDQIDHPALPHASCVRSFRRLFEEDPGVGQRVYDKCRAYAFDQTAAAPPEL
jgi:hypothetical protein